MSTLVLDDQGNPAHGSVPVRKNIEIPGSFACFGNDRNVDFGIIRFEKLDLGCFFRRISYQIVGGKRRKVFLELWENIEVRKVSLELRENIEVKKLYY